MFRLLDTQTSLIETVQYHELKNMMKRLDEIHSDEILLEEFMKSLDITGRQLASDFFGVNIYGW